MNDNVPPLKAWQIAMLLIVGALAVGSIILPILAMKVAP